MVARCSTVRCSTPANRHLAALETSGSPNFISRDSRPPQQVADLIAVDRSGTLALDALNRFRSSGSDLDAAWRMALDA